MIFKACMTVVGVQTAYKLLIGWKPDPVKYMDRLLKDLYIRPIMESLEQSPTWLPIRGEDE